MKQIEETPKEKSRALAVIQDDEGFYWSEFLPEEDAAGYAFMATTESTTSESTYTRERALHKDKRRRSTTPTKKPKRQEDGIRIVNVT
ncbi:hypothetical protein Hanom_Chr10g00917001 [Helianthus anomalus]